MSTKDCKAKQSSLEDAMKKVKETYPIRRIWYALVARIRLKVGISLYQVAKKIRGWQDSRDWYGDNWTEIRKQTKGVIYCPLVTDWVYKKDCPPCEMCPDD